MEANPGRSNERLLHFFEIGNPALIYTECWVLYDRDSRRRDLWHASVSVPAIHFSKRDLTWDRSLLIVDYNVRRETPSHHLGSAAVMSTISRVTSEEGQYRDETPPKAAKRAGKEPEQTRMS